MHSLKLAAANTVSWAATIVSLQAVKDSLTIIGLMGSITVSVASVWWIMRQARSLDKRDSK